MSKKKKHATTIRCDTCKHVIEYTKQGCPNKCCKNVVLVIDECGACAGGGGEECVGCGDENVAQFCHDCANDLCTECGRIKCTRFKCLYAIHYRTAKLLEDLYFSKKKRAKKS